MRSPQLATEGADLHLVVIGVGDHDGSTRARRRPQVSVDHVHLWDALYDDDLAAAISSCDILCSTSEYEGFGLTIVEGMSCGLPVLAMAAGGVTDLVVDGSTGFLVPVGDLDAFVDCLIELCEASELRESMGSAGRHRAVERFDARSTARSFTSLYEELARA